MRHGFTMIELVIVIGLVTIISLVVGIFSLDVARVGSFIEKSLQNQQSLEVTFQAMDSEVRSMGPSSLGAYPIESVSTTSLVFFGDIDRNGVFDRVRYFLPISATTTVTSTLQKGIIVPTGNPLVYATSSEKITVVLRNVIIPTSSPTFEYFDATYTGSQVAMSYPIDINKIRLIRVNVSADVNPGVTPKATFYTTTINIRNLRSN